MSAPYWPIVLEEGSDFDMEVEWENHLCVAVNVASYGASLQIRNDPDDPNALLTASVGNNRIELNGATRPQFVINIPAASIDAIVGKVDECAGYTFVVWPGLTTPDVNPKRLLHGSVKYSRSYLNEE